MIKSCPYLHHIFIFPLWSETTGYFLNSLFFQIGAFSFDIACFHSKEGVVLTCACSAKVCVQDNVVFMCKIFEKSRLDLYLNSIKSYVLFLDGCAGGYSREAKILV